MTSVNLFPAFVLGMFSKHNFAGALDATLGGKHPYMQHWEVSIFTGNTEMGSIESAVCFRTEARTAQ